MTRTIAALAAIALAGCSINGQTLIPPPPAIAINATTGAASVAAPSVAPAVGSLPELLNAAAVDDANALNAALVTPPDTIGVNFYTAIANLNDALNAQGANGAGNVSACGLPVCLLTTAEGLRRAVSNTPSSLTTLVMGVVSTGNIYIADSKAKGIAAVAGVGQIVLTAEQSLIGILP